MYNTVVELASFFFDTSSNKIIRNASVSKIENELLSLCLPGGLISIYYSIQGSRGHSYQFIR